MVSVATKALINSLLISCNSIPRVSKGDNRISQDSCESSKSCCPLTKHALIKPLLCLCKLYMEAHLNVHPSYMNTSDICGLVPETVAGFNKHIQYTKVIIFVKFFSNDFWRIIRQFIVAATIYSSSLRGNLSSIRYFSRVSRPGQFSQDIWEEVLHLTLQNKHSHSCRRTLLQLYPTCYLRHQACVSSLLF